MTVRGNSLLNNWEKLQHSDLTMSEGDRKIN